MGIQEINVILGHYQRQVNEQKGKEILRGGNKIHFHRMVRSIKNKAIYCFRCNDPIERDTEVISVKGNGHTKIYHTKHYKFVD